MRKFRLNLVSAIFLVLVSISLAGCGGGGTSLVSDSSLKTGTLVITLRHNGTLAKSTTSTARLVPVEATRARIKLEGGVPEVERTIIEDVEIPSDGSGILELTVPIGTYKVSIITYKLDGDYGSALTGGVQNGVIVEENTTNSVSLTLNKFDYSVSSPTYVQEDTSFTITVNSLNDLGFGFSFNSDSTISYSKVLTSTRAWAGDTYASLGVTEHQFYVSYGNWERYAYIKAPSEAGTIVYYQIRTPIKSFNKSGLPNLYFYFPSVAYGDGLGQVQVQPTGNLAITIQ